MLPAAVSELLRTVALWEKQQHSVDRMDLYRRWYTIHMATMNDLISADEVLAEHLPDPAFRAEWERTALARAVALAVVGYRVKHNLTQTRLAKMLGMRQPHVARIESGEHNPSLETLQRLSRVLGLRFIVDVAPADQAGQKSRLNLPSGVEVVEDMTADSTRVMVTAG